MLKKISGAEAAVLDPVAPKTPATGLSIKKVLFPTDFSNYANYALKYAIAMATHFNATLYVLHVNVLLAQNYPPEVYQGMDADYIAYLKRCARDSLQKVVPPEIKKQLHVEEILEKGVPYQEIVRKAQELGVDVIVMSTRGRTGLDHTLTGSTTERVVSLAPCPVFSIKYPEFEFSRSKSAE
ncbi:MAG: universal stress protein [Acidobacteriia bacterium]|nr:universal stress protein [Terriglobia bacterium]